MTNGKSMTLTVVAVCMIGLSGAAAAAGSGAYQAEASLVQAVQTATDKDVDGVNWHCEGDKCIGKAERRSSLDSYMKECRKVAAALGKLTAFSSRGRQMSKVDLAICNRAAA